VPAVHKEIDHGICRPCIVRRKGADRGAAKVYLVGGGIASMAAAAFMIRDGDIPGHDITILEELDKPGGSLDGSGSSQSGYLLRDGWMLESKYLCTYELFSSIPTLDGSKTVTQAILAWNETMKTSSASIMHAPRRRTSTRRDTLGSHSRVPLLRHN
jgi:oleate hydratase